MLCTFLFVPTGATFDLEAEYEQSQAELLAEFEKKKRVW